jgi:twitching motility protein PilT
MAFLPKELERYLLQMREINASDLHLRSGSPPVYRINGKLVPVKVEPLGPEDTLQAASDVVPHHLLHILREPGAVDFVYRGPQGTRFRMSCFHERGSIALSIRVIKQVVPRFEDLNLPLLVRNAGNLDRGIVLVSGVTGSGKSTTVASLIDHINKTRDRHIVTIEDPIEFLFENDKSLITQIELGMDTTGFPEALKRVLRQDPDIIVIGEMRDPDTIRSSIMAAETGHLVFATLHTIDAKQTIDRMMKYFSPTEQQVVRVQLSYTIQAIFSQRLAVRSRGRGRIPVVEIIIGTPIIRKLIAHGRTKDFAQAMQNGEAGMQTFDQSLASLLKRGEITMDEAMLQADDTKALQRAIDGNVSDGDKGYLLGLGD